MKSLYRASRVHTHGEPGRAEWVLVDERHVERVGTGEPPAADRVVDLPGTTILPGFVDAHVHLTGTGIKASGLDLSLARSAEALLRSVREASAAHKGGRVLGQGWDETKWATPWVPTLAELDAASPGPLVLVRADGHISLGNTAALKDSGAIDQDGAGRDDDGLPTGMVAADANAALQRWWFESLPDEQIEEAQLDGAAVAARMGVTCVHEMSIPAKRGRREFEVLMGQLTRLPTYVAVYFGEIDIPYALDYGVMRLGGDLFLDGSIGAGTAAMSSPYADREDTGVLYHEDDELAESFHNAHLAGAQVGVHAIGDAAVDQALRVWERVYHALDSRLRRHFRARRHRVEHFEVVRPDQVERAAALGLAISVQPTFDAEWGGDDAMYATRLGAGRAATMNPFRTLVERGLEVGSGSDAPVTSLDPMLTVWALENHHNPRERLTRAQAIRMGTLGAARLAHLESKKGRLHPGAHADFVAYESDPYEVADVRGLLPVLTVSQGREVYAR